MYQPVAYFFLISLLAVSYCLQAEPVCEKWLATADSVQGKVDTQHPASQTWSSVGIGHRFCYGDKVRTSKRSRATLAFKNGPRVTLSESSTLSFSSTTEKKTSWIINLIKGSGLFRSRQPQLLNVHTPFINAVHEGTEFLVTVNSRQTEITVFDGQVAATNQQGEIHIKKGYTGVAAKNQSPYVKALVIRPVDAVQWSLYYPPIINVGSFEKPSFQPSIKAYQQGNPHQALTLLEQSVAPKQDLAYLNLKSSLLLMLGSVDEALSLIDQTLLQAPNNSSAFALQSIIAVTKNRQDKAFNLAQKAVTLNPQSATAQIALSYAYQSKFNIAEALASTQKATHLSPDNALAWARLAELQLSSGERSDALTSAQKAQNLNPKLGRTQTVLGFNYLAQTDIDQAKATFTQAIKLNSADPLAHLGLGLAKIRKGAIEEGARDLETAVSLDPDNAIMRSYLGKAYYELRNDGYGATELKIAKEVDPNDPTPWFYDAIRKQTVNRPVEALNDMQKAIELNDNRGVYRSKLLLDEDEAAKSANMARIYQDLGFDRVALKQAWTSLGQDYTNPSAHRFLSDTLQGRPRHRIARASELLQAQLFQPINTVPVQPQLTSENIGILNSTGPGRLSSNEYDPLFTSNGAHILLNGAVGSNNTLTDSAIISGVYDRFSLSLAQFHYQTDGFRANDDYKQNIYNAFAQIAVTLNLNLQVEFKREDVTAGDVPLRFNGFHRENFRESIDKDTARFGLRYKIDHQQDFIASAFYVDQEENEQDKSPHPFFPTFIDINTLDVAEEKGYQTEIQYILHPSSFNIISGVGFLSLKKDSLTESFEEFIGFGVTPGSFQSDKSTKEKKYFNSYVYSTILISPTFKTTLGVSFDSFDNDIFNRQQFNPKVGAIWTPDSTLTIRAAFFRTLKRPMTSNQTIEPSQVAGFNQFFDGNNGTTAWHYGFGVDYQPLKNLYLGGELNWRDTVQPVFTSGNNTDNTLYQGRDEVSHLTYLYWAPLDWLALSTEYHFDEFRREFTQGEGSLINPKSIKTHFVPIKLNFFHLNGVFSSITANYVNQKAEYVRDSGPRFLDENNNDFWTIDTVLGYRLPYKIGSLSLEVRNLFDKKGFEYNSVFDASGPQLTHFVPEREIFFKLNLTY